MNSSVLYEFEGQQLTLDEIRALVPAIKAPATIRRHLSAGRNTRIAMLTFDSYAPAVNATRKKYHDAGKPPIFSAHVSRDRS